MVLDYDWKVVFHSNLNMLCFLCGKFSFWPSSNSGLASQSWIESAIRTKWLWNTLSRSGDIKLEKVQDTMALWYILDPVRLSPLHGALWYFHISPPWLSEYEEKSYNCCNHHSHHRHLNLHICHCHHSHHIIVVIIKYSFVQSLPRDRDCCNLLNGITLGNCP